MSNFTINSKELLKTLQFAGKAVPNSGITPIFECVLLECKKSGELVITGSDTNTVIQTKTKMNDFDLDGQDVVKIAAPYELLAKTLSNAPNVPVKVEYIIDDMVFKIHLTYQGGFYVIPCEDPKDFFRMPLMSDSESISIPAQTLQRGINAVIHCVSDDGLRPAMTGVYFSIEDNKMELAATNGFVIGDYSCEFETQVTQTVIAPTKFLSYLAEFIADKEGNVTLSISDRFINANFGDWIMYGTLIDERFPAFKGAVPTDFNHTATINAELLKSAIKRGIVYGDPKTATGALRFMENNLFLNCENTDKSMKSEQDMQIESEIEDLSVGFDLRRLTSLIKGVSGDFTINIVSPERGVVILPDKGDKEEIMYLIMPVMLNTVL